MHLPSHIMLWCMVCSAAGQLGLSVASIAGGELRMLFVQEI